MYKVVLGFMQTLSFSRYRVLPLGALGSNQTARVLARDELADFRFPLEAQAGAGHRQGMLGVRVALVLVLL